MFNQIDYQIYPKSVASKIKTKSCNKWKYVPLRSGHNILVLEAYETEVWILSRDNILSTMKMVCALATEWSSIE